MRSKKHREWKRLDTRAGREASIEAAFYLGGLPAARAKAEEMEWRERGGRC